MLNLDPEVVLHPGIPGNTYDITQYEKLLVFDPPQGETYTVNLPPITQQNHGLTVLIKNQGLGNVVLVPDGTGSINGITGHVTIALDEKIGLTADVVSDIWRTWSRNAANCIRQTHRDEIGVASTSSLSWVSLGPVFRQLHRYFSVWSRDSISIDLWVGGNQGTEAYFTLFREGSPVHDLSTDGLAYVKCTGGLDLARLQFQTPGGQPNPDTFQPAYQVMWRSGGGTIWHGRPIASATPRINGTIIAHEISL